MNQEYDEYPTALASAAFAIKSLEDSRIQAETKANAGPDTSTNIRRKSEDKTTKVSKPRTESRKLSDEVLRVSISEGTNENMPEKVTAPAPSIKRSPTTADEQFNSIADIKYKNADPKKKDVSAPPIKKTPTLVNSTATTKSENTFPKPDPQSTTFPTTEIRRQGSKNTGTGNTKADVWEKAELAKINERYEKLSATILDRENKKTNKAKRKLDKTEIELERRRGRGMQHYRTKMEMIDQIAGGARAQAEQNRRKEEVRVKDEANRIRTTGKSPPTCFCF